jgi:hypothetical protein
LTPRARVWHRPVERRGQAGRSGDRRSCPELHAAMRVPPRAANDKARCTQPCHRRDADGRVRDGPHVHEILDGDGRGISSEDGDCRRTHHGHRITRSLEGRPGCITPPRTTMAPSGSGRSSGMTRRSRGDRHALRVVDMEIDTALLTVRSSSDRCSHRSSQARLTSHSTRQGGPPA